MAKIDLFKGREPHYLSIPLINGKTVEYKIPADFTVEEIERIYELEIKAQGVVSEPMKQWLYLLEQVYVALSRYQPDVTLEFLKKNLTPKQTAQIILFMQTHNFSKKITEEDEVGKKKSQN